MAGDVEEPNDRFFSESTQVGKQRGSVDIRSVAGTGPFGRITASDVEAAAGIAPSVAAPPPPPPPAAAAKATTTSSSSPPLLPGSSVVPFTAMQSDVSKNMIESLFVPMFRVGYPVNTDALDAPYEKVKPKGVTMTALLAKLQGWLLLSILWLTQAAKVLLSTINWAICKAIDLLELLKIEEEMLSAQSRKIVKDTAKRPYSRPAQPITFATFAQDVLQGSA
ncbi:dihydrolipoyllysine-residue acetyltransferase component 4 of pyruvate dehydrogenase complex, chloroplastic [Brassica rapa]|uniref:dihydrolipoyllysine-residue acetyltransferase component 4 of pyruvate dehydrogenase complex, chloroplastic n=1 Tax=Brassica campestris TaxID=3711 RepID=UPI00142E91D9|nr:dihydrolipoyllysine-residue acetyltransferase component 4 of pyruvate dehydrogenase complex, chloroplastic [Brassica rapa]